MKALTKRILSFKKNHKIISFFALFCFLIILAIILIFFTIKIKTHSFIYEDVREVPHTPVAIIPGAYVREDGTLSPVLKDRVNAAIKLYREDKVEKILVTGDNSTLDYNEVNPTRDYLIQEGVMKQDIFLDHAGFDTYSSMYRARDIFLIKSATIVTQSFHLPRAVFTARELGIEAYGYSADRGTYLFKNNIREYLADVKAVMNLMTDRQPKFLGDMIPITGDGRDNI